MTTNVGKIRLGVEIDANNLSAKLGDAVRAAIAPALADIQRELNKIQKEYDRTADSAEKSDTAQVAGARAVADALDKVDRKQVETAASARNHASATKTATEATQRQKTESDGLATSTRRVTAAQNELNTAVDIFGKKSPQAEAAQKRLNTAQEAHTAALIRAAAESRASADTQVNDYQRIARAAEESAAKQTAANRVAGGGHGGGRGGALGFLTGPVGLNSIALGAQAIPAALTGITLLAGAVVQLGQAGLALPAIYGAAGASIGVAALGFHGMKDAITALNKAAESGKPEDLKKVTEAFKDMDPAAAAVARTVSGITQGPLKDLGKMVQGKMFAGFDRDLQGLSDKAFPKLKGNIGEIGTAWNSTLKTLTGSLGADKNISLIDRFLGNTAKGQVNANKALDPIIHAFSTLTSTGGEFLPRLGDALGKVADRFDNFISKAGASGQLWKWIDEGINGMRALGNSALNIGKTLTGITHASGDGGFLGWLEKATGRMQAFINSAKGQGELKEFFTLGREGLHEWGDLFKALGPDLASILKGFATWGSITLPIVTAIAELVHWLDQIPGLIQSAVVALLAFKTASGVLGLLGKVGIGPSAGLAAGAAGGAGGGGFFGGGKRTTGALLGIAGLAGGNALQRTSQESGNGAGELTGIVAEILSGAATGGLIGSAAGPVGTAIGAGVGTLAAGALAALTAASGENKLATEAAARAQQQFADSLVETTALLNAQQQSHKSVQDALIGSGGKIDPSVLAGTGELINQIPDQVKGEYGETRAKQTAAALKELNLTTEQLTTLVTGAPPQFDALTLRLQNMGIGGQALATHLAEVRNQVIGMATTATTTAPLMQQLATAMNTNTVQAAVNLNNAFQALPKNIPLVDSPQTKAFIDIMHELGALTHVDNNHQIIFDFLPSNVVDLLHDLNINIQQLQNKTVQVGIDPGQMSQSLAQLGVFGDTLARLHGQVAGLPPLPAPQFPVYDPGNPSSPNPFPWLPANPPRPGGYQGGIMRRGFAGGGWFNNPWMTGNVNPDPNGDTTWSPGPGYDPRLPDWWQVGGSSDPEHFGKNRWNWMFPPNLRQEPGDMPWWLGPTLKPRAGGGMLPGYSPGTDNMMVPLSGGEGIIIPEAMRAIGGDALYRLNSRFRSGLSRSGYAGGGVVGGFEGGGVLGSDDTTISLLTQIRDLLAAKGDGRGGAGLGANLGGADTGVTGFDPVQGFFNGIKEWFGGKTPGAVGAAPSGLGGAPGLVPFDGSGAGSANALIAFAQASNGGKYAAASDLTHGLADCSGAVSDLVEFLTKGRTSPERLFSTTNEAAVLQGLGAVPGLVPGSLQIGLNSGHTAATLPNGVNFESGGSGGGVVYGGPVGAGDRQFTQTFSLPTDASGRFVGAGLGGGLPGGIGAGMPAALGNGAGGPVPVYVTNWGGGPGDSGGGIPPGLAEIGSSFTQALGGAAGQVAGDVGGGVGHAVADSIFPAGLIGTPTHPDSRTASLVRQDNPLALAKLAGLQVPDYTRQGGGLGDTQGIGAAYDASGRLYSDTGELVNRTFTDLGAQINAMRSQTVSVMKQVDTKLSDQVLQPVLSSGVTAGVSAVGDSVFAAQGQAMGQAAGPIIASAVATAIPTSSGGADPSATGVAASATNGLGGLLSGVGGQLMAGGGAVYGGTPGVDSVPILAQQGEWMLNTDDVTRMGGSHGVAKFIGALRTGGLRHYASGGNIGSGPSSSSNVGADFFGVSQIPIIGTIINLLINVLLKVIGVNLDMRNTLTDIGGDFRAFRGDAFKAFDAQGRLYSDTSALSDRSATSSDTAADERIKILQKVIAGLIQFIIDKVIVPLMKAVAQSAIQALGSAVGAGISGATGGAGGAAGGAASSFITSLGDASVDIGAQIGQSIADALVQELVPLIGESLQSVLPQLMTTLFNGLLPELVLGPISSLFTTLFGGVLGAITALFGGVFGGAATLIPGIPFDDGGMASGKGWMPKAVDADELVLNPTETDIFTRFTNALAGGGFAAGNRTVHAPITVMQAGPKTAEQVQDRLLKASGL